MQSHQALRPYLVSIVVGESSHSATLGEKAGVPSNKIGSDVDIDASVIGSDVEVDPKWR